MLAPRSPINHDPALQVRVNFEYLSDIHGRYEQVNRVAEQSLAEGLRRQAELAELERINAEDLRASVRFAVLIFLAILAGSAVIYVWG